MTSEQMKGKPLKQQRDYVFVKLAGQGIKHMFGGDHPANGSFTVCGQKIVGRFLWSQRATALGKLEYCRDCEEIWSKS